LALSDIGYGALLLTLAAAVWATVASALGAWHRRPELVTSARNALLVTAALSTLSAVVLFMLLTSRDFSVRYVYEHVSTYLKPAYVLSAFWAGMEGSQLLWLWMLALFTGVLVLAKPTWDRELRPYAMVVLAFTQTFFAVLLIWISNPFELMATVPAEGVSLNPLLQNFWMIVHPPIVFASYALWTIPAAYALAALVTGKVDATWLRGTRRWTLAAWITLGIGILVGGWWAYLELGWGGYWGWDPVENSSFIPWLVGTAFVHSAILQERRDMFRAWTLLLGVVTFVLTIFATFVTRSGLIQSVHAFAKSPIGYYYLGFMLLVLAGTAGLVLARNRELEGSGELGDLFSREFVFVVSNLLLLGSAAAVLLGTLWPTLTGSDGQGLGTGLSKEGYNRFMGPLSFLLVLLVGLCPLVEWRKTTLARFARSVWVQVVVAMLIAIPLLVYGPWQPWAVVAFSVAAFVVATILLQMGMGVAARMRSAGENLFVATSRAVGNNRRRYGAQLIHLATLLIVIGIIGSQAFQEERQVALAKGESVEVGRYRLVYTDLTYQSVEEGGNKVRTEAVLDVYRGDRKLATVTPERNQYQNVQGSVTEVALRSNLMEDLYIVLASMDPDGLAAFAVYITPLVVWLWIGGLVMIIGTLIAAWPTGRGAAVPARLAVQPTGVKA
jgi:cytochrome c-type biogenesis protein CcmF